MKRLLYICVFLIYAISGNANNSTVSYCRQVKQGLDTTEYEYEVNNVKIKVFPNETFQLVSQNSLCVIIGNDTICLKKEALMAPKKITEDMSPLKVELVRLPNDTVAYLKVFGRGLTKYNIIDQTRNEIYPGNYDRFNEYVKISIKEGSVAFRVTTPNRISTVVKDIKVATVENVKDTIKSISDTSKIVTYRIVKLNGQDIDKYEIDVQQFVPNSLNVYVKIIAILIAVIIIIFIALFFIYRRRYQWEKVPEKYDCARSKECKIIPWIGKSDMVYIIKHGNHIERWVYKKKVYDKESDNEDVSIDKEELQNKENNELVDIIETLKKENKELVDSIESLTQGNKEYVDKVESLKKENKELNEKKKYIEEENKTLNNKLRSIEKEKNEKEERSRTQINKLNEECERYKSKAAKIERELSNKYESEIKAISSSLEEKNKELGRIKEELSSTSIKLSEKTNEVLNLTKANEQFTSTLTFVPFAAEYARDIEVLIKTGANIVSDVMSILTDRHIEDPFHVMKAISKYTSYISKIDMEMFYADIKMISEGSVVLKGTTLSSYDQNDTSQLSGKMRQYFFDKYLEKYIEGLVVLNESMAGVYRLADGVSEADSGIFIKYRDEITKNVSALGICIESVRLFEKVGNKIGLSAEQIDAGFETGDILELENCIVYFEGGRRPDIKIKVKVQD